jgi:hypothetical protein
MKDDQKDSFFFDPNLLPHLPTSYELRHGRQKAAEREKIREQYEDELCGVIQDWKDSKRTVDEWDLIDEIKVTIE